MNDNYLSFILTKEIDNKISITVKPFIFAGDPFLRFAKICICGVLIFALSHCGRLFSVFLLAKILCNL